MLPIAGQTARQIGLKFVMDAQGLRGSVIGYTKFEIFFQLVFKKNVSRATPGPSSISK